MEMAVFEKRRGKITREERKILKLDNKKGQRRDEDGKSDGSGGTHSFGVDTDS